MPQAFDWDNDPVFARLSKIFCELRAAKIHFNTSHVVERRKDRWSELSVTI